MQACKQGCRRLLCLLLCAAMILSLNATALAATPELLLHYDFAEDNGTSVLDKAGSYTGTLKTASSGKAELVSGANRDGGYAAEFVRGSKKQQGGYLEMPAKAFADAGRELTLNLWVKLDDLAAWTQLLSLGTDSSHYFILAAVGTPCGKKVGLTAAMKNGGSEQRIAAPSGVTVTTGEWAMVTYTQSSSSAALYLNGQKLDTSFYDGSMNVADGSEYLKMSVAVIAGLSGAQAQLGRSICFTDNNLDGMVGDVRLYQGALSDAAIAKLYQPDDTLPKLLSVTQVSLSVENGTDLSGVLKKLPSTVTVQGQPESGEACNLSASVTDWSCTDYDGDTAGSYTFTGTLDESLEFNNPDGLTASAVVTVLDERPLEYYAMPSASYYNNGDAPTKLNDGSLDFANNRWTAYNTANKSDWVEYAFNGKVLLRGCSVYWYDDGGGVTVPTGLTIKYLDDAGDWVDVKNMTNGSSFPKNNGTTSAGAQYYGFDEIVTTKIRLYPTNPDTTPKLNTPGIVEWKLDGEFYLRFQFGSKDVKIEGNDVKAAFELSEDLSRLAPKITIPAGATITPASGTVQDFTTPVTYTLKLVSGTEETYTVTAYQYRQPEALTVYAAGSTDGSAIKANFLGDSITWGYMPGTGQQGRQYHAVLTDYIKLENQNYGLSGSTISCYNRDLTSFATRARDLDRDADLMFVFGGTNDYGDHPTVFGSLDDTRETTFCGGLRVLIEELITSYPDKQIVFMTPIHRSYELPIQDGKSLSDYVDTIKQMCEAYGIPVIDAYNASELDFRSNTSAMMGDGLHPNEAGHRAMAGWIYRQLQIQNIIDVQGEVDTAKHYLVSATSTFSNGSSAAAAFDGSAETSWAAASMKTQYLAVDLGTVSDLSGMELTFGEEQNWKFNLLTSADGESWKVYANESENSSSLSSFTTSKTASARYVALEVLKSSGCFATVSELKVLSGSGDNLALNKLCGASSSTDFGYSAFALFDDEMTSSYCANGESLPQSVTADLGETAQINSIDIHFEKTTDWTYNIQVSSDGTNWNEYISETYNGMDKSITKNASARYVKFTVTGTTGGVWDRVWELKINTANEPTTLIDRLMNGVQLSTQVLHYDFSGDTGTTVRDKAGSYDGTLKTSGGGESKFDADANIGGSQALELVRGTSGQKGGYVDVPVDALKEAGRALTINLWIKPDDNPNWNQLFGVASDSTHYALLASNGNPYSKNVGLTVALRNGGTEERIAAPIGVTLTASEWNMVTYVEYENYAALFLNGQKLDTTYYDAKMTARTDGSEYQKLSFAAVAEAANASAQIGRSPCFEDNNFDGIVGDFALYQGALSSAEIKKLYDEKAAQLDEDAIRLTKEYLEKTYNNTQTKVSLTLPTTGEKDTQIEWTLSSVPGIMAADGTIVSRPDTDTPVTLTAKLSCGKATGECRINVTVIALTAARMAEEDATWAAEYLDFIVNDTQTSLPETAPYGSSLTWSVTSGHGEIRNGVLYKTEGAAENEPLTLSVKASINGAEKTAPVTGLILKDAYVGQIMSYFTNSGDTRGMKLSYTYDLKNFMPLNNGKSVVTMTQGTKRMRDPSIFRLKDGTFGVVSTHGWDNPTVYMIDSPDLCTFENERLVKVADGARAWAPECNYDRLTGQYVLYWADPSTNGGYIRYNTSPDLVTFSAEKKYIGFDYSLIDASVKWANGKYYMAIKREDGNGNYNNGGYGTLIMASADKLTGPWTSSEQYIAGKLASNNASKNWCEGPTWSKSYADGLYYMYFDETSGRNVIFATNTDIADDSGWKYHDDSEYGCIAAKKVHGNTQSLDSADLRTSHCGITDVTQKELDRLIAKWGVTSEAYGIWFTILDAKNPAAVEAVKGTAFDGLDLPETVSVQYDDGGWRDVAVTWSETGYNANADSCELTGTIVLASDVKNPSGITVKVTVNLKEDDTELVNLALGKYGTKFAATHTNSGDRLEDLNDGIISAREGNKYDDGPRNKWSSWPQKGTQQTITLTFDGEQEIHSLDWYATSDGVGVKVPEKIAVQVPDGNTWKTVATASAADGVEFNNEYTVNCYDQNAKIYRFKLYTGVQKASQLRLILTPQDNLCIGASELEVWGKYSIPGGFSITLGEQKDNKQTISVLTETKTESQTVHLKWTDSAGRTVSDSLTFAAGETAKTFEIALEELHSGEITVTGSLSGDFSSSKELTFTKPIPDSVIDDLYEEVKTPYEYDVIVKASGVQGDWDGSLVDNPNVFSIPGDDEYVYMTYVGHDGTGYRTGIARSRDMLTWEKMGVILDNGEAGAWDEYNAAGYIVRDHTWGQLPTPHVMKIGDYAGQYVMTYLASDTAGYEAGLKQEGVAFAQKIFNDDGTVAQWTRYKDPILSAADGTYPYEKGIIWKMQALYNQTDGKYYGYYNAATSPEVTCGVTSDDMIHWTRMETNPLVTAENGWGTSHNADPDVVKIGDYWVMFYFTSAPGKGIIDSYAVSEDMVHWQKSYKALTTRNQTWSSTYAHKPCVVKHNGVVYHYYCAVGDQGRTIAVDTSVDLRILKQAQNVDTSNLPQDQIDKLNASIKSLQNELLREDGSLEKVTAARDALKNTVENLHIHDWSKTWSSNAAEHWHTCSHCDAVSEKAKHEWDDGVVITPATKTDPGEKLFTCRVCSKTRKETIPVISGKSVKDLVNAIVSDADNFPFDDVPSDSWYYSSVRSAWKNGLIDGMTANEFRPDATLTVAQAIKLAAALHQLDHTGRVSLTNGRTNWYDSYVNYAVANKIIEKDYASYTKAQMDAPVTRGEFVHIFHGAMESYEVINTVADNAIPDVKLTDRFAPEIYEFYRAGILTGVDAKGTFQSANTIKRSEAAAILLRMYKPAERMSITLN